METEEFEGEETDIKEAEDESAAGNDEKMDDGKGEDEGQMEEDTENTEGTEGSEKQDEGEKPKVSGYHLWGIHEPTRSTMMQTKVIHLPSGGM